MLFSLPVAEKGTKSLPLPPPLGFPVPDHRHAVSVQLPTWQDMRDMAVQVARVTRVQKIGYPRSFLNQDVVEVNKATLSLIGRAGEKCLVFPAMDHAMACKTMILDMAAVSAEALGRVRVEGVEFMLDYSSPLSRASPPGTAPRRFYVCLFPEQFLASAMVFWRLTGTGISSRLAQSMLAHGHQLFPASLDELPGMNADVATRNLADTRADRIVRARIVKLLSRASIHAARFSPSDVFLYPSGMAAIYQTNKLLQQWQARETVVFGFPYELTLKLVQTYGTACRFYGFGTPAELDEFENSLASDWRQRGSCQVQSVWCECASNPLLRTVDLARIRRLADKYGFVVVIDDTIGSFANVDVAGVADVIVTSLTKSFNGEANVMAGSIVLNPSMPFHDELKQSLRSVYVNELYGADASALELNSRHFLPRAAIMNRNAQLLVSVLDAFAGAPSSTLTHVYYPLTCWSRANYEARMRRPTKDFTPGYGGLFTLEFESVVAATVFFDAVRVHKGPSLGASVTLAQPYVQTVFMREKAWAASYGLDESIVRISVGLEDEQALTLEFVRALRLADRFKAGRELKGHLESLL